MDDDSGWYLTRLFHSEFKKIIIPKAGSIEIGRDNTNSCIPISMEKFKHVSRKHCVIRFSEGRASIIDRFSSGGTYIGNKRLSLAHPGEVVLKEGDLIGIGTHNNDCDDFYKKNDHVLFYRLCKTARPEELIIISDDEDDARDINNVDVHITDKEEEVAIEPVPRIKDEPEVQLPSSTTNGFRPLPASSTVVQCDEDGKRSRALQTATSSGEDKRSEDLPGTCMLKIPEERLVKQEPCSWEEEYDRMLRLARNAENDDSILYVSDEEYTDQQYSQVLWEEIKQESVDACGLYEPEHPVAEELPEGDLFGTDEENSFNRWKHKLNNRDPRIDAGKAKPKQGRKTIILAEPEPLTSRSKTLPPKRRNDSVVAEGQDSPIRGNSTQHSNTGSRKPAGVPKRRPSLVEFDIFQPTTTPAVKSIADPPKPTKGIPKRRASICEFNTAIQKKLKRRYSVSDRCPVKAAATPSDAVIKENRAKRLKQVADHEKQLTAPTIEPVKTGLTKPRVKITENNRGVFLTTPVAIKPKPASRSRPVVEGEMQICTQSTTLEELRAETDEVANVVDVRPAKMTFKSVERLSNVDRPVPSIKGALSSKKPINTVIGTPPVKKAAKSTATDKPRTQQSHALKGILKTVSGKSKIGTSKHVRFTEIHTEVLVPRYLPDYRVVDVPANLAEILRQKEMTALSDILGWHADWLDGTVDDPFGVQLLPMLENFQSLQVYRDTLQPILMRELWQDIRAQYRRIRQPLPLTELTDVHAQEISYSLCEITCKAFIRTQKKQLPWGNEIGVLYYASKKQNRACRLFAYVINRYRENSLNRAEPLPDAGEWFNFSMYAALSELEDLRSGSRFSFCPITNIMVHLRGVKALHLLQYSPLLPNMLSPAVDNRVRVALGNAFVDRPEERDAIVARIQPGTLNDVQMDVVLSILDECSRWDEPSISLIQGPPGTGKSRVISHLALELMYIQPRFNRLKVLICAQSNTAVDVIVKRLMSLQKSRDLENQFDLLRIGTRDKVDVRCLSIFIDERVNLEVKRAAARELNNNMRETYRSELLINDNKIRQLEKDLANNPDVNRSRLDEYYKRRARLNEQLSQTTSDTSYKSAEQRNKEEREIRYRLVGKADIVCTTLGSCAQLEAFCQKANYDVCIIDEATQCTELYSLLPLMYRMPKMILVGDINQLPATVLDQESVRAGFRQSLFSRLQDAWGDDMVKKLTVQYRMHPEISRWPNEYFYMQKLKNDPSTLDAARGKWSLKPYLVVSLSYDQELTQVQHEIYNRDEIEFVVGILKGIVQNCRKESSIAIITPYQRHKVEIMNELRQHNLKQVQVHSIDSVQGKEYDVVIVSLARSNGAGFLNAPERINVALTRARQCLVLCGNFGCLRQKPVWKSLLENAEKRDLFVHMRGDSKAHAIDNVLQRLVLKQRKKMNVTTYFDNERNNVLTETYSRDGRDRDTFEYEFPE